MPLLSESPVVLPIHRKILAFSFIGWIFDFYDLLLLSFLVSSTTITKDLALSRDDVAILLGTALAFTAVGGLLGGALADRYGRKPLLMITILVYSVGTLLSGLATGMWTLLAARAITGIGVGGEWAVAHALVGETVPPHVRGRYGSYLQSGSAFARFFASMVGNLLAPWIGWRAAFMLSALPALMVVFIRRQMPESDVWLQSVKAGVASRLGYVAALSQMVGPALRKTTTLALTVTTFNMAAYWFKTIWLPTYLHETRGLSLGDVAWLLLMDQIGSVAGYFVFGYSSDYFGRRPSFTAFSLIKALGLLMVTLGWTLAGGNTWTTYGFMLLVGFGEGNWGCIGPLLNEVFPTPVRAAALGIIYNTARGVQFLAPVIIGLVAARSSFGAGIALAVPFALLAGASVWALPETKGVRLMEGVAMKRQTTATLAFMAALGWAGIAAAQTPKNDYGDGKNWLCRPGRTDACAVDQSTTSVAANGTLTREDWKANPNAAIDCFYVYPTVSTDPGGNSDMNPGPEENGVVRVQLARFASQCRVFAPMYRQATLTQLRAATAGNPMAVDRALGYNDVLDAWNHYLQHDNNGRGVVLIGHSQGSGVLTQLMRNEIDGKPVQSKLISALLLGTNLAVPKGKDVGGAFQHIPLCHSATQIGCAIAYVSFRSTIPPPANSRFGRVQGENMQAACVNPAALGGGSGELHAYLSAGGRSIVGSAAEPRPWVSPAKPIDTPFVSVPGLLTAHCVSNEKGSYLEVTVHGNPADPRVDDIAGDVMTNGEVNAGWGLHLIDVNLAMGNLVDIVRQQGKAFVAASRKSQ